MKKYALIFLSALMISNLVAVAAASSRLPLTNGTCRSISADDLIIHPSINQFYFLRHGVTDWNKAMLALGPQDLSLNEKGITQIVSSLSLFDGLPIKKIITSNLKRCIESANLISQYLGGIPIIIDNNLEERRFGNWATDVKKIKALIDELPEGPSFFIQVKDVIENMLPIDAESEFEFQLRVIEYLNGIPEYFDENTLIVSHGCFIDAIVRNLNISENNVGPKEYAKPIIFKREPDNSWSINPVKY